ncbi:MAG: MerR family transcriptional regulator [Alphaproteobacteria bacterium]|nr:MerR family transcriptional regulator [Alphaproteobacteria bacterium]
MVETADSDARRPAKSAAAFRTISEVAQELDVPQHVLRFWESKFSQVKPLKRGGGRRYYRPEDVVLLRRIRQCLYQDGYTIKGVQKLLREGALKSGGNGPAASGDELDLGIAPPPAVPAPPSETRRKEAAAAPSELHAVVAEVLSELTDLRDMLRRRGS